MDLIRDIQAILTLVALFALLVVFVVIAIVVVRQRAEMPALFRRMKRLKLGPTGFELEVFGLHEAAINGATVVAAQAEHALSGVTAGEGSATGILATATASSEVPSAAAIRAGHSVEVRAVEVAEIEGTSVRDLTAPMGDPGLDVSALVNRTASDPRSALIALSIEIEREVTRLLARAGHVAGRSYLPLPSAVAVLRRTYPALPEDVATALLSFWKVRNKIIHGGEGSQDELLSTVDSGAVILKTLGSIVTRKYVVRHPGIHVYSDPQGKEIRTGVTAVVIDVIDPEGRVLSSHVHPTRCTHFEVGMEVAWEWNIECVWGESWYRDPESGEVRYAWTSSAEFIGRDIGSIYPPDGVD